LPPILYAGGGFPSVFTSVLAGVWAKPTAQTTEQALYWARPLRWTSAIPLLTHSINWCCDQPKLRMNMTRTVTCSSRTALIAARSFERMRPLHEKTNSLCASPAGKANSIDAIGISDENGFPMSWPMSRQNVSAFPFLVVQHHLVLSLLLKPLFLLNHPLGSFLRPRRGRNLA
jgi:hypothetical protein